MAQDRNETHYFLDGNPEELQRLQLGHDVIKAYMGSLVHAPLDFNTPGLRILDSATADGLWLRDLRSSVGLGVRNEISFVGTDITHKYFPKATISGITLATQSMTQPWPESWSSTFDLVHQRMALPAAGTTAINDTLQAFIKLLKPGGWIQLVEPDHSISIGPAMADFFRLLRDIFAFMGTSPDYAPKMKDWFIELGLEKVEETVFDIPIGDGSSNPRLKVQSVKMIELVIKGLTQVAESVTTSFSREELQDLSPRIREEVMHKGGLFRLHCVWGRKPM